MYSRLVQLRIVLRREGHVTLVAGVEELVWIVHGLYVIPHVSLSVVAKLSTQTAVVLFVPFKCFHYEL